MLNGTNGTHHPDNDNGTPKDKEDTISFTVSVDSVNGAKKKYASHLLVVQLIFSTGALTLLIMQRLQQFLLYNSVNIFKQTVWFVGARRNIRILRVNMWISLNPPHKKVPYAFSELWVLIFVTSLTMLSLLRLCTVEDRFVFLKPLQTHMVASGEILGPMPCVVTGNKYVSAPWIQSEQ